MSEEILDRLAKNPYPLLTQLRQPLRDRVCGTALEMRQLRFSLVMFQCGPLVQYTPPYYFWDYSHSSSPHTPSAVWNHRALISYAD